MEGVDRAVDLDEVAGLGADYLEGYLFGSPMSADEVRKLMEKGEEGGGQGGAGCRSRCAIARAGARTGSNGGATWCRRGRGGPPGALSLSFRAATSVGIRIGRRFAAGGLGR